ncbi:hypothetical protein C0Q70_12206 [Pomacea canaliculata]|uniref:L-dopachrome isomerase n=1 Tax=Pomacea canaliculata TaxID=400727 RepID=A0A2T7P0X2_POMCA|nr:macrophage migration inhibitory factor-like [Pomacea canaliculata]PVD27056.1 hypothetical protein C0Q70_12206 [Pomacea canaliculata]
MPIICINTNVPSRVVPTFFHAKLTNMMFQALQKPREVVFIDLRAEADLMMGGDRNACVYATIECIGRLNPEKNLEITRMLEDYFIEHLKVRRERIVIIFKPVSALYCSFNGELHDPKIEQDLDLPLCPSASKETGGSSE